MGIGEKKTARFNLQRVREEGLVLRYRSTYRSVYQTSLDQFFADEFIESHKLIAHEFDELADITFPPASR